MQPPTEGSFPEKHGPILRITSKTNGQLFCIILIGRDLTQREGRDREGRAKERGERERERKKEREYVDTRCSATRKSKVQKEIVNEGHV